jgi:hypothetical protein
MRAIALTGEFLGDRDIRIWIFEEAVQFFLLKGRNQKR